LNRIFESNGTTYERITLGQRDSIRAGSAPRESDRIGRVRSR
jgi:hypothetical protein